jgi:ectoine hydroxylase-related dioxygenase (phytanoyl-CoA dioxygenase family)
MQFTKLSDEQRRHFDEQGYLIVRNAVDDETMTRLIEAGDRLIGSDRTENRQKSNERYDGFRNVISLEDAFIPLLTNPKTVPLIVQLLSPNIHLMTSHLIYKYPDPPGTPETRRDPGWHQDIAGTNTDLGHADLPRMVIKVAYYLTDLSEPKSGATLFAPGSNNLKEPLRKPDGQADPDNTVEPLLHAGDAVLFENRTWHAGAVNFSGRTRKAVMFGYGYRWMSLLDGTAYPDELIDKVDDVGKQLLDGLKDPQGRFIPGGINKPLMDWAREHGVVGAAQFRASQN